MSEYGEPTFRACKSVFNSVKFPTGTIGWIFQSYLGATHQRYPAHSDCYLQNGRRFTTVFSVAGLIYQWGKKGPKLRSVGENL